MNTDLLKERLFEKEFIFTASRSGGPGGQNVNKVNSKIELRFNIHNSALLTVEEKELLTSKLGSKLSSDGDLIIVSQNQRSQIRNREDAENRFYTIIAKALTIQKRRKPTKPTFTSKIERLDKKKKHSTIKRSREKRDFPDE